MRKHVHAIGRVCLIAALAVLGALGCTRAPPERALRDAATTLQRSIEQRDASAVQATLADDFVGPDGMNRDGARRMAQLMFLRYRDVGATVGPLQVAIQGRQATVRFTAALTGGSGLLPEEGRIYDVETGWREVGGEWQLVNAHWSPR